jgi:hypothetical protein
MRVDQDNKKSTSKISNTEDKTIIHNVIIADASSSMQGSKYNSSMKSIKAELEELAKDDKVYFRNWFIEFAGGYGSEIDIKEHSINKALNKDNINFTPRGANGNTPLYNTLGIFLNQVELNVKVDERVLVKVFTDGADTENGKGQYNATNIVAYLKKLIDVNNWTITFNCTEQDKFAITKIGVPESNILTHNNTAEDIERVSYMRTASTLSYSKSVSEGVSASSLVGSFYSKSIDND